MALGFNSYTTTVKPKTKVGKVGIFNYGDHLADISTLYTTSPFKDVRPNTKFTKTRTISTWVKKLKES